MSKCKQCCLTYKQTETYKQHQKKYHQSESFQLSMKKYLTTEKSKIRCKKYRDSEKRKVVKKRYNQSEKGKKTNQLWSKIYRKNKYITDIQFNIAMKIRSRIFHTLRRQQSSKNNRTIDLLGCSFNELQFYIKSLFTPEMTWEKVLCGEIHIDHIKPCASFDLTDFEQQKQCFHYTNLQPLWAKDNLTKGKKYQNE